MLCFTHLSVWTFRARKHPLDPEPGGSCEKGGAGSRRRNPLVQCMPKAQQRKHNQVHSVDRKIRKKENALIKVYLKEASFRVPSGFPWRYRAGIYKKLFTLLKERCEKLKDKPTKKA